MDKNSKTKLLGRKENGYIAFTSLLVISAITLVVATSVALLNIDSAQSSLSVNQKQTAIINTKSCAEEALVRIRDNYSYTGGTLNLNEGSCVITATGSGISRLINITTTLPGPPEYRDNAVLTVKRRGYSVNIETWQNL